MPHSKDPDAYDRTWFELLDILTAAPQEEVTITDPHWSYKDAQATARTFYAFTRACEITAEKHLKAKNFDLANIYLGYKRVLKSYSCQVRGNTVTLIARNKTKMSKVLQRVVADLYTKNEEQIHAAEQEAYDLKIINSGGVTRTMQEDSRMKDEALARALGVDDKTIKAWTEKNDMPKLYPDDEGED